MLAFLVCFTPVTCISQSLYLQIFSSWLWFFLFAIREWLLSCQAKPDSQYANIIFHNLDNNIYYLSFSGKWFPYMTKLFHYLNSRHILMDSTLNETTFKIFHSNSFLITEIEIAPSVHLRYYLPYNELFQNKSDEWRWVRYILKRVVR